MSKRDSITYVYYFGITLMLFGGCIWAIAGFLPVGKQTWVNISFIGLAFMYLGFFILWAILKGEKADGKTESNQAEPE